MNERASLLEKGYHFTSFAFPENLSFISDRDVMPTEICLIYKPMNTLNLCDVDILLLRSSINCLNTCHNGVLLALQFLKRCIKKRMNTLNLLGIVFSRTSVSCLNTCHNGVLLILQFLKRCIKKRMNTLNLLYVHRLKNCRHLQKKTIKNFVNTLNLFLRTAVIYMYVLLSS